MSGRMLLACLPLAGLCTAAPAREDDGAMPQLGQTWVESGGEVYGARADATGPLGGGPGYTQIVTSGQHRVSTPDELIAALTKAQAGEVIFVEPRAELDFTALVYAEKMVLKVPGGVTVASNRGQDGSPGALVFSDAFQTTLFQTLGPGVRFSGLRLRGPDPKPRLDHHRRAFGSGRESKDAGTYYYALPNSTGVEADHAGLEVDNCELSGWSYGAVLLADGDGHHVHHNYIHHNQRNGLGYGVCHGYGRQAVSLIEYNVFDYNRHSIAATGKPGNAYEASNNVEIGHAISHCFDMHGGSDRNDGTSIAGDWMKVHHNTFMLAEAAAVVIRGVPQQLAEIHHNWFAHASIGAAVRPAAGGATHVECRDNACGREKPVVPDRAGGRPADSGKP